MRLIDADILLDKLYDHEFITLCPLDEVSDVIDYCPTVDAEPVRHGRWEESKSLEDCFWVCSNCKFPSQATAAPRLYNYCPHCGAKMDEEAQ